MDVLQGRLAELVNRLDTLRGHSLTKLADALGRANLTVADVAEYVKESPQSYYRSLVVRRDGYELLILTWKPGQGSVPHDHAGSIAAMQVFQGEAAEGSWRIGPDGYVVQEFDTPVRCGEMTAWQDAGVHTVCNSSKTTLVTAHIYAPPLKDFRRYVPRPEACGETAPVTSEDVPTIVVVGGGFGAVPAAIGEKPTLLCPVWKCQVAANTQKQKFVADAPIVAVADLGLDPKEATLVREPHALITRSASNRNALVVHR